MGQDQSRKQKVNELSLPEDIYNRMKSQVDREAPIEACGLLGGSREGDRMNALRIYPTRNETGSPVRYSIDPVDLLEAFNKIEESGLELVAIYHSHPGGPPVPSPTDIAEAYYPDSVHLIWSKRPQNQFISNSASEDWYCRGYIIAGGQSTEIQVAVTS